MSKEHISRLIEFLKEGTRSTDSQAELAIWLENNDYSPTADGVTRSTLEDKLGGSLSHTVRTCLNHLVDIELVEEYLEREGTYVIAEWHPDVFVMGNVDGAAREGIEALLDDLDDHSTEGEDSAVATDGAGVTRRQAVADMFDLHPRAVEDHLRSGDPVNRLNGAVEGLEEHGFDTGANYGEILFRNPAYRYRLTPEAEAVFAL